MQTSRLLKIGQVAKILGVSVDTLRRWEQKGKLVPIKTPGQTRLYSSDQLQEFNPTKSSPTKSLSLPKLFNFKLPKTLPLTLSFIITTVVASCAAIAVYLTLLNSSNILSTPLQSEQAVNNPTLAQASNMDNTFLNKNAKTLESATANLVGESDLSLKQPSVNADLEGSVDNSWTITSEDCIRSIIDKGI